CARSWAMAVAGLGLLAACERPLGPTQPPPGDPVVQIVTSPPSVTLDPYQTQQFLAYGRTQAGDSVAVVVSWSVSGGTITSGGLYTAGQTAGPYHVAATQSSGGTLTDTAAVTITTIPVASVTVSPTTASVPVGATRQFTAVTKDSAGNTLTGRGVTWASSNTAVAAASCVISSGAWQNVAIPSQAGAFEAQFDAIPTTANMNGVVGLSNGPAADWTNLAAIVRFDSAGTIDARNGGVYAATATIP